MGPPRENRHIDIGNNEDNIKDNTKILLSIQGAGLRRFHKYEKRLHLTTAPLWYNCKKRNAYMELMLNFLADTKSNKSTVKLCLLPVHYFHLDKNYELLLE